MSTPDADPTVEHGGMLPFEYDEPASTYGGAAIVLGTTPIVIAALSGPSAFPFVERDDRIWLSAVVGWQANTNGTGTGRTDVLFEIHRDSPSGMLVYSALDSGEAGFDRSEVTPLMHVDTGAHGRCVSYFLLASAPLAGSVATVVGPITLVGQLNAGRHAA